MDYFAVVIEWKDEPATLMETVLSHCGLEKMRARMKAAIANPRALRVGLVRLSYAGGHPGLIPPKEGDEEVY